MQYYDVNVDVFVIFKNYELGSVDVQSQIYSE